MKRSVISYENLPQKLPIWQTVLLFLLMDYYEASEMVQGVVWTIWVIIWIGCLSRWWVQEEKKIFNNEKIFEE